MTRKRLHARRRFLQTVLGASAAAALAPWWSGAAEEAAPPAGPQTPPFKIGVCDWMTGKGGTPDALKWAANVGLDGVQVSFGDPSARFDLRKEENRQAYARAARDAGVQIASLGMGILNNVPYKSDPRTEQWVGDSVDVCQAMGLRVVLLAFFAKGDLRNDKEGTAEVIKRLKAVAPKAEKAGVYLGIESWLSADEHLHVIDSVGSPNVTCYYDVGNSRKMGYDIHEEIRRLGKARICEFHAKDYKVTDGFGTGEIDFKQVRKAMDDIGYRGWIHLEGMAPKGQLEQGYRKDGAYLKGIFPPQA